MINKIYIDK